MAQHTRVHIPAQTWTQITNADATYITFQIEGPDCRISGAESATAPTDFSGAIKYRDGEGELLAALSEMFPGISAVRVYAYSEYGTTISVSHA